MRAFSHRLQRRAAGAVRWVIAGQLALNLSLLGGAAWLAASGNRLAFFLVVLVPLAFVPFSYARVRLHRLLEAHVAGAFVWPATALGLGFDAIMVAQLLTGRQMQPPSILYTSGVAWIGAVWFSGHALLLAGYTVVGLVRQVRRVVRYVGSLATPAVLPGAEAGIGRRELMQKAGLFGAALPFGVSLSSVPLSYDFRVEEREIVLPSWPAALDRLRVVHLSDIHVGGAMDRRRLLRVAALTNDCRPDLVLHSGDFLTHRAGDYDAPLYEALGRIHAPYGQWACLGNHDFDNPQRLEQRLRDCGVTVLRNRVAALAVHGEPIEIAGIDFQFEHLHRALTYKRIVAAWGPRRHVPRLLLNHDPIVFKTLPPGCADLVLSGHTHGGQIGWQIDSSHAITVIGLAGLPDQGVFRRADMYLYVTRCVGFYGYPMRIGIPPEVALLVLRSERSV